jgi:hypothetical protein
MCLHSIPYPSALLDQVLALDLTLFAPKMEKVTPFASQSRNPTLIECLRTQLDGCWQMFEEFLQSGAQAKSLAPMPQSQRWLVHQVSLCRRLSLSCSFACSLKADFVVFVCPDGYVLWR